MPRDAKQTQPPQEDPGNGPDHKVTLTISTLSGDYTDDFPARQKLQAVVERTVAKLHLVGNSPWVLERGGVELDQGLTIESAELTNGDVLTLSPPEGGGGSGR